MRNSSTLISSMPIAHAGLERDRVDRETACPRRLAKAVREFANVLIRIPNHATP